MLSSIKKKNYSLIILGLLLWAPICIKANNFDSNYYYSNQFLFCLDKNVEQLKFNKDNDVLFTNNLSLNIFIQEFDIDHIEAWLPNSTENDQEDDIFLNRIYRAYIKSNSSFSIQQIAQELGKFDFIHSYEYERIYKTNSFIPNDPMINQQCSLGAVKAYDAWSLWDIENGDMPGDENVLLASVDSGVQWDHPDLVDNIWQNLGEDADGDGKTIEYINDEWVLDPGDINGVDDDGNTYADDLIGWDPSGISGGDDNDPNTQVHSHGTHVAGTLAAATNNGIGVASAAFNSSILPVKCTRDNNDEETINDGYPGIQYAAKAGYYLGCQGCNPGTIGNPGDESPTFAIIQNSWGNYGFPSTYEQTVINTAHELYGAVILASAGNDNEDLDINDHYPSDYDNVINVAAVSCNGNKASFSNYGSAVDIAAPGVGIMSTVIDGYESYDGTSMAGPNAASCIGLLASFHPEMDNDEIIERILNTADDFIYDGMNENYQDNFGNRDLGHGMVDCFKAVGFDIIPNLSYSFQDLIPLDGDGDSNVNPGESAELGIYLYNEEGWTDATNVIGVLSCDNPGIDIINNTYNYGDIASGGFGEHFENLFTFSISDDIQVGDVEFTLNITADGPGNYSLDKDIKFPVSINLNQQNWPQEFNQVQSSPLIMDIDMDGDIEIAFGDYDGFLHVMNSSGQELPGFPFDTGDDIWGSIASADINLDGSNEIVVCSKSKHLYILDINGNVILDYNANQFLMGTPSIGNVDSDEELEIVFGAYTNSGDVFAINHDGSNVEGFPYDLNEKMQGVALADLNSDGLDEIVFSTESENFIGFIDPNNGNPYSTILYEGLDKFKSDPSVLKIESNFYFISGSDGNKIYSIDSNGNIVFEFEAGAPIQTSVGFGFVDEQTVGLFFGSQDNFVYGIDQNGLLLDGWPIDVGGKINVTPAISDLDGDGQLEVVAATDNGMIAAFNLDGSVLQNFPIIVGNSFIGSPAIVDIDSDNDLEIYIGTTASLVGLDYKLEGDIVGYWNMYHGNYKRTSFYEFDPNMNCSSPLLGDINCDGGVDVLDIMMVVDFILDISFPFDYQAWSSDLNSDANINIFDIISIVAIILD